MKAILGVLVAVMSFMVVGGFESTAQAGQCSDRITIVNNDDGTTTFHSPWILFSESCRQFGLPSDMSPNSGQLKGACRALGMRKFVSGYKVNNNLLEQAIYFNRNGSIRRAFVPAFLITELTCK